MSLLDWTDGLSIGIAAIDDDHRHLIHRFNLLHRGVQEGWTSGELKAAADALIETIERHFASEEHLLSQLRLPSGIEHRREHRHRHSDFLCHALDITRQVLDGSVLVRSIERLAFSLTEFELVRCDFEMVGHLLREGQLLPAIRDAVPA
jgi:hemerythrin